jgi:isoamylase
MNTPLSIKTGSPTPLGATLRENQINFALASQQAQTISLCLYDQNTKALLAEIPLSPDSHKTGDVWHVAIDKPNSPITYAYKITQSETSNSTHLVLDPYAKSISSSHKWNSTHEKKAYHPLGEIIEENTFDWENIPSPQIPLNDLIIYEMHVRGFTCDSSSDVKYPGTFLGVIEKIPYLLELGVNAIELMPIQEFNESEYLTWIHPESKANLCNFWGYSTVNFFSPMNRYASSSEQGAAVQEFKTMVKSLHQHGIEVILDVVLNHTAEGGTLGPTLSFKGIDKAVYYLLDEAGHYLNFSGCGNSINANHPRVVEMIIQCLRYWTTEMHVDGFRFDLASALTRGPNGLPLSPCPLIQAITQDPILAKTKLIAEPWDAIGLYEVGFFATETSRWSEWNGKYRDCIRRFIRGSSWASGEFATRLCGSQDLYHNRKPYTSINFLTSHDGFSLADLVAYESKHNFANGEHNRDGHNDNFSWNCGTEGPTQNLKILALRERQRKNFHLALMLSLGVPMLTMGDEYGHTKQGNNNAWCQDNKLNWFLWNELKSHEAFFRFYRLTIAFRKKHPVLRKKVFLTSQDIDWHGIEPFKPDWNSDLRFVSYTLKDADSHLFIAFNAQNHAQSIHLPPPPYSKHWRWAINTASPSPHDIFENDRGPIYADRAYKMQAYSAIVLESIF